MKGVSRAGKGEGPKRRGGSAAAAAAATAGTAAPSSLQELPCHHRSRRPQARRRSSTPPPRLAASLCRAAPPLSARTPHRLGRHHPASPVAPSRNIRPPPLCTAHRPSPPPPKKTRTARSLLFPISMIVIDGLACCRASSSQLARWLNVSRLQKHGGAPRERRGRRAGRWAVVRSCGRSDCNGTLLGHCGAGGHVAQAAADRVNRPTARPPALPAACAAALAAT